MGLFDQFPYTNFHELNLDWILQALKELEHTIDQFVSINALKYADPIQWDITSQYEKNTIVIDPQTGTAYISVQPVPIGVSLTNPDYWTVVFDLGSFVVRAAKNFADTYEAETTLTATVNTPAGGWLVWGDTLYKALVNITAGDSYVEGGNIQHFTIEEVIGHLEDLDTTDKTNLVAAINEVAAEVLGKIGDLADLNTTDKSNLVAAINEVLSNAGDLDDLNTTDKSNLVAALNEVLAALTSTAGDLADLNTTDKSNLVAAINEVNDRVVTVPPTRMVVISDSYGVSHESAIPFTDTLQSLMGLSNSDYFAYAEGSLGFVAAGLSGHTAEQLLTLHASDITNHDTITHVLFVLGGNDVSYLSSLESAITSCFSYVKTTYPNARIIVAYSYNKKIKDATWTNALPACIAAYNDYVIKHGGEWVNNFMYIMHNATFFVSDNIHPNTAGNTAMAQALYSYINTGICDVKYFTAATATSTSGTQTFAVRMLIDNDIASISGSFVTDALTVTSGVNEINIGTISPLLFAGGYGTCYCPTRVQLSTGEIFPANLALEGGTVRLSFRSNIAGTVAAGTFIPFTGVTWATLLT